MFQRWEELLVLLERYLLFACNPSRQQLYAGRVHHDPYRFSEAGVGAWDARPIGWNGLPLPEGQPAHACTVSSVDVSVFAIEALPAAGKNEANC